MTLLAWDFYKAVKEASSCAICSAREHLTFHHVEPSRKRDTVYNLARWGTLDAVSIEMNKCVVLCETCHCAVHSGRINGWLKGKFKNGQPSQGWKAREHMPILTKFFGQAIHIQPPSAKIIQFPVCAR